MSNSISEITTRFENKIDSMMKIINNLHPNKQVNKNTLQINNINRQLFVIHQKLKNINDSYHNNNSFF